MDNHPQQPNYSQQTYDEHAFREYEISLFPELSDNNNPDSALISQIMSRPHGYTSPSSSTDEELYLETNSATNMMPAFSNVNLPVTTPTVSASSIAQHGTTGPNLEVNLQHKPRGSKGLWQNVEPGQRIRVTKLKGKRLKLEIKIHGIPPNEIPYNFRLDQLQVHLLQYENDETPSVCKDGFTIESLKTTRNVTELEVKVFKVFCKRLQFLVQIPAVDDSILRGSSSEFATHNSGTLTGTKVKTTNASSYDSSDRSSPSPPGPVLTAPPPAVPREETRFFTTPVVPPLYPEPLPETKRKRMEDTYPPDNMPVTVVQGSLDVKGVVRARAFMQFSDVRLKTNFSDIVDAVDIVTHLKGQYYEWNPAVVGRELAGKRVIGLIAQEVQKVLPEVVHKDEVTGYLSVSYAEILPVLIDAFNQFLLVYKQDKSDMNVQVENLKLQVNELSASLAKTQKAREAQDMQVLLYHVCFLSRELLRTQEQQSRIEKTLIAENSPVVSPRSSPEDSTAESMGDIGKPKGVGYSRFYQYLTGMFSLSMVGVVIGLVLLVSEGSPYTSHYVSSTDLASTTTTSASPLGRKPSSTGTTGKVIDVGTTGTTGSLSEIETINVVETNQGYIVGAILLSVGLVGMVASIFVGIVKYVRDRGIRYSKADAT